jgi:hypothetical protein
MTYMQVRKQLGIEAAFRKHHRWGGYMPLILKKKVRLEWQALARSQWVCTRDRWSNTAVLSGTKFGTFKYVVWP